MEKIYLDNGATSFPKPREVADAVYEYMTSIGANINRGGYQVAYDLEGTVFETREMLMEMFGGSDCKNVVFTKNVTEYLGNCRQSNTAYSQAMYAFIFAEIHKSIVS